MLFRSTEVVTSYTWASPTGSGTQSGIAQGPDGAMWFTDIELLPPTLGKADFIGRITQQGAVTLFPVSPITAGRSEFPNGIAAGPDGAMWFTELTASRLGRIDMSGAVSFFPSPAPAPTRLSPVPMAPCGTRANPISRLDGSAASR